MIKNLHLKTKFFKPAVWCCCFFFVSVFAGLDGKWKGILYTPDGDEVNVVYNFKVAGDKLTGTAESEHSGVVSIDSGKVTGNNFSFYVTVDGNPYPHSGTIYGDSCGLDVDFGGQIVHTRLLRDMTGN